MNPRVTQPDEMKNPERYVVGEGTYDNLRRATVFMDGQVFAIVPRKISAAQIVVVNLLFLLFFGAFLGVASAYATPSNRSMAMVAIPIVGVVTCLIYTGYTVYMMRRSHHLGAFLIYEQSTGDLILPRKGLRFTEGDIVHLQLVTSRPIEERQFDPVSELNLIAYHEGERQRWTILREDATTRPLMYVVQPLLDQTDLPVFRYRIKNHREVTIIDMRQEDIGRELMAF